MITVWKTPIVATVEQIIQDIKLEVYSTGLLKDINNTGADIMCTCPFHGNGREHNPSLGLLLKDKTVSGKRYEAGTAHCFTCGYTADLPKLTADILGLRNELEGFKWLVGKYNYSTNERETLDLNLYRGEDKKETVVDEADVRAYESALLHSKEASDYLRNRKISDEAITAYRLGYDSEDKTVLFPIRDLQGRVVFYKGRSITGKHFYNAKDIDKSELLFGLYEAMQRHTAEDTVWITESEIDALTLISYGYPAIAVMGSHISDKQCRELEKSPFRHFILALDNDGAGRKGNTLLKTRLIPKGFRFTNLRWQTELKDINDLAKAYGQDFIKYLTGY